MRLKKIKLAGFKSFVDPTSIPFPDDMTAIVGPNGCGKSNVIDAVRWVLGESSAKNLRGDAMTDVIFNGSSARKPVSQSSVELVFDNSSGRIQGEFANYSELSIKRLVNRDPQSFYYLNGTKCRRRDITDLFLGTGLGPRSYAIIEQGMISRLIESKPQELRVFIEEAAGISKYKERRRETENRIRHTKENLERLEDVRGELGQQLEKLQRQASAAKRYKDLKQKERRYKGELAAIRWLKHSQIIAELEAQVQQQQTDIEAFIAQQRGDEKGIAEYKQQQQELKLKLEDIQQQYFRLGTDITRLEQNQLHRQQRKQQVEHELGKLNQSLLDSTEHEQQDELQLAQLGEAIAAGEPEVELLEQQLEAASDRLMQLEDELGTQQQSWREGEDLYYQLKQQVQNRHSQIQSTMNMQMRTQQRIGELEQDIKDLNTQSDPELVAQLQEQIQELGLELELLQQSTEQSELHYNRQLQQQKQSQQQELALQGQIQKLQALESSLMLLLAEDEQTLQKWLQQQQIPYESLWQFLQVEPGWERAVELACQPWKDMLVVKDVPGAGNQVAGGLFFEKQMSSDKPVGTLASKITNTYVPKWLTNILLCEEQELMQQHDTLQDGMSLITRSGNWQGADWKIIAQQQDEQGQLQRAQELQSVRGDIEQKKQQLEILQTDMAQGHEQEVALGQALERHKQQLEQSKQQQQLLNNQLLLQQQQLQQYQQRLLKLEHEQQQQQQMLEQENIQLEEFAAELEELEIQLEQRESQKQHIQASREQLQQQVTQQKEQTHQLQIRSHQLEAQLKGLSSQKQTLLQTQERHRGQLQQLQQKQQELTQELQALDMPMAEQGEALEQLLEQRVVVELEKTHVAEQLSEVELCLSDIEKGQQGIHDKIEQMRNRLEQTRLESEGHKVRAKGVLEQLDEMQQVLKPLLEQLPQDANETAWQQELDKTQNSVSRLGAVNLAAVEEYEVQSERKLHLDTQNEDLSSALETLENAIRKIDRETRSRFKDTFDKVNTDLKMLFPKVFGGGSAYLDLTGDDLLETGVTIMARPPGKKNSTIHLLSGGEKALTALSLVFAIFRLNPAPFCLLDEVDAPLDDANVGRFCKLVSEMSKTVQFIYITHNKIAMEMAKHLTGVTMAEPGVSRMVAVDVDEAVGLVEA